MLSQREKSKITIEVCIGCNSKQCCNYKAGIELYEFIKGYISKYSDIEIEINMKKCECKTRCNGTLVKIDKNVYTNVDKAKGLEIIKKIAIDEMEVEL